MTPPHRPALYDVLSVLTTESSVEAWRRIDAHERVSIDRSGVCWCTSGRRFHLRDWRFPREGAVCALIEAEHLPDSWADPARAPKWWCGCQDVGRFEPPPVGSLCPCCPGAGVAPVDFPALVAVASLGAPVLARAEALVEEAWRTRVVWRAVPAHRMEKHHRMRTAGMFMERPLGLATAFSREILHLPMPGDVHPVGPPWSEARRVEMEPMAWAAMGELHRAGFHLLAHAPATADRATLVVLGVEASP